MKGANRYMKIFLVVFWEKNISCNLIFLAFRSFFTVWLGMVKLSQATVDWMLKKSGHNFFHDYYWKEDMIRILKQWRHNFLGKYLCGGYCMDILWCLCVGGQNSGFCKASLRICYVSLFKCKGPWMLKAVIINCHV